MEKQLFTAHFQLTGRCNLSCRFCGQARGMLASGSAELTAEKWLALAEELQAIASEQGSRPEIVLWGGEPLLYEGFDDLTRELFRRGFALSVITNGTLLHKHLAPVAECIDSVFVSVDGVREAHDAVRGQGVFEMLEKNLRTLNEARRGKLTLLTTVSEANVKNLAGLPLQLAELGADEIVLQPLIYLTGREIDAYRAYSRSHFGCDYPELEAWRRDDDREYQLSLCGELERIARMDYPVPVRFVPHRYPEMAQSGGCRAPWHRVHVRHDGEVGFCTDFFGFSAGNVSKQSLRDIFCGEAAERFRAAVTGGDLPICDHCPWRFQRLERLV